MLKQVGKNEYELATKDKIYRIKFSLGVKDRLVNLVVGNYTKQISNDPFSGLVPAEVHSRMIDCFDRLLKCEDDDERAEVQAELNALLQSMTGDSDVNQTMQLMLQKRLIALSENLKYEIWSELLTQRDMEGIVKDYISPARIKDGGEFDEVEDQLLDLLAFAYEIIEGTLKKTYDLSEKTTKMLGSLTSNLEMLSRSSQSSTQPTEED